MQRDDPFAQRIVITGYKEVEELRKSCFEIRRALIYSWLSKLIKPKESFAQTEIIRVLCYEEDIEDEDSKHRVYVEFVNKHKPRRFVTRFNEQKSPRSGRLRTYSYSNRTNKTMEDLTEEADCIRYFATNKDQKEWAELTERDRNKTRKENHEAQFRNEEKEQTQEDEENENPDVDTSEDLGDEDEEKEISYEERQREEMDIVADSVKNRLDVHHQIEEYLKNSVFDILTFAVKHKIGIRFMTFRDWALNNICYNAKRIIILMLMKREEGYEWNAHDICINVMWQRQWEKALGLRSNDIHKQIKNSESFTHALWRLHQQMHTNQERCVYLQSEDAIKEAFAATQLAIPSIASVVCNRYEKIAEDKNLRPQNIDITKLKSACHAIDTINTVEGWDKEECVYDTENADTINLPKHRKLYIDPHIANNKRILIARGYEIGRSLTFFDGLNIRGKDGHIKYGATGEVLNGDDLAEGNWSLLQLMGKIGWLSQQQRIDTHIHLRLEGSNFKILPETTINGIRSPDEVCNNKNEGEHQTQAGVATPETNETPCAEDSASCSDTETDLQTPMPLNTIRKIRTCSKGNKNRVIDNLKREHVCVYCEISFSNEARWALHFERCEDWLNTVRRYKRTPIIKANKTTSLRKDRDDNEILSELYQKIEECIIDVRNAKGDGDLREGQLEILAAVARTVSTTKKVIKQREGETVTRKLIIQQYKLQKERDDFEIITHRTLLADVLNKVWTIDNILENCDIKLVDKKTGALASNEAIMNWNHPNRREDMDCKICGTEFNNMYTELLHKELLYCKHDGEISRVNKKHLTREKACRLKNGQMDLLNRIELINKAIYQYALETKVKNEDMASTSKKRRYSNVE